MSHKTFKYKMLCPICRKYFIPTMNRMKICLDCRAKGEYPSQNDILPK